MRKTIIVAAFILTLLIARMTQLADDNRFSIDSWKQWSGYTGDVCIVAVDNQNKPYCSNGATYEGATVNAYEGYQLWVMCYRDHSEYACEDLQN